MTWDTFYSYITYIMWTMSSTLNGQMGNAWDKCDTSSSCASTKFYVKLAGKFYLLELKVISN